MFVLTSEVTIGKLKFSGVNSVVIRKSISSLVETATIIIPSIAKVMRNGKADSSTVMTSSQFKEGDEVTIKLGYNGDLKTEFRGFVKRININMPVKVECEGYCWLLRRKEVDVFERNITLKDLLTEVVSFIEAPYRIEVVCVADVNLSNVQLCNMNALAALDKIIDYTDGAVTCFFIQPGVLWCGSLYSMYAKDNGIKDVSLVRYKPGFNALRENTLDVKNAIDNAAEVTYSKKTSTGSMLMANTSLSKKSQRVHRKVLNNIADVASLKVLADEKAFRLSYTGYEGKLTGFLQPFCLPGDNAYVADPRYPDRDSTYLVESTEVVFGTKGARRIVEVGPKMGFSK